MGIDKSYEIIHVRQTIQALYKTITEDFSISTAQRNAVLWEYRDAQDKHTELLGDRYHEYNLPDYRKAWLERFYETRKFNC